MVIVGGLTLSSTMNNFKIVLIKSHLLVKKKKKKVGTHSQKRHMGRGEKAWKQSVCRMIVL